MDRVETWTGQTHTHGFHVEVFHDTEAGEFKTKGFAYSPPVPQQYVGGKFQTHDDEEPIVLTDKDVETLRERFREHLRSNYGDIEIFEKK